MKRVVIESPLAGDFPRNIRYARLACLDSLGRGEAPYATHLLFTQFLDDGVQADRHRGFAAGEAWTPLGELVAVYEDYGVSDGMRRGIARAESAGIKVEYRRIGAVPANLLERETRGIRTAREQAVVQGEEIRRELSLGLNRVLNNELLRSAELLFDTALENEELTRETRAARKLFLDQHTRAIETLSKAAVKAGLVPNPDEIPF